MIIVDVKEVVQKIGIRRLILLLLSGVLLIYISSPIEKKNNDVKKTSTNTRRDTYTIDEKEYIVSLENGLERVLKRTEGIEDACVMITTQSSKEEIILKDTPYVREEDEGQRLYEGQEQTVLVEDEGGGAIPYVVKELNPTIEGVVCIVKTSRDGMEREIHDTIMALFDVPVHKIKVMNMK